MIDPQKRSAIYCLHTQGMPARKIARELKVDRNTVRCIIAQKGEFPDTKRSDKIVVDTQQIVRLHRECNGYVKRIHEEMQEQCGQKIGYSTLTAKIREPRVSLNLRHAKLEELSRLSTQVRPFFCHDL